MPAETIKYLTKDELGRLLKVIRDPRDRAIWVIAYFRGLRASEVGKLEMSHWKPDKQKLLVRRLKGSKSSEYLLSPQEIKALKAWLKVRGAKPGPIFPSRRGRGISRQMLDVLMRKYGAEANIPADKRHFHVLKHSIATHLVERGVEILQIQGWLGHRSINSTLEYAHLHDSARDELAERLYLDW
jgi:type 1 fimbriae regulatory protein FimB